jgi:hypothetical protein
MRLLLLVILPCLASAGSLDQGVPRPAAPKGLQVRVLPISRWNGAERARVGALAAHLEAPDPVGRPRLDLPLIPYPDQVPARYRGFLHAY